MEPTLRTINAVISALFFICYTYQFLYIPLVLLKKRRPLPRPAASHRYAVLIAARNEENVIAGLLDSLAAQTYDMSLVTVFVAADNCTDSTAAIARAHGAVVYERFNHVNVGKGYALDFLLQQHELFHIVVHLVGVLFHHGLEGFPFHEFRHDCPLAVCFPHFQQLRDPQTGFFYSCLIQCFIQNVGLQIAVSEHLYAGIAFPIAGFLQPFQ